MIEDLPTGWAWSTIGEIALMVNPGFPSGKHNKAKIGIPHIRPMNINFNGGVDLSEIKYVQVDSYDSLQKGDVLFNNTNSPKLLGKTTYISKDTDWAYSNHMTRIRINDDYLNPAWIAYCLHMLFLEGFYRMRCTHHVNQASINSTFLKNNVSVPIPPLPEQTRIVSKIEELLSRLDAGIDSLKQTQILLKKYRQSILKSAVEGKLTLEWRKQQKDKLDPADKLIERILNERREKWEAEQLSNFKAKGKNPPKNWQNKYKVPTPPDIGGLPELPEGWVWSSLEIISEINPRFNRSLYSDDLDVSFVPMKRVSEISGVVDLSEIRKFKTVKKGYTPFKDGDIIFAKITPCMENGKIAILSSLVNGIGFGSTEFHVFRLPEYIPREYLFYFLVQDIFRKNAERNMTGSVGQKRVPVDFLRGSIIPIPPILEQIKIGEEIERLFSVIFKMEITFESEISRSNSLRQAILKHAFEGKLVPQDPNDEPASVLLEKIKAEKTKIKKPK